MRTSRRGACTAPTDCSKTLSTADIRKRRRRTRSRNTSNSLAQSFTLHPAGSNPQFDLDFIGRLCPNLPLHYHRIDMTTLRDSLEAAGWDVRPEEETPVASAHRTGTCLDRDIRQYARIIRHLAAHPVRYVATKAAR